MLLQGVQHLALSDWVGRLPSTLLRTSSTALLSLAVSDVSTAEGAAAAVDSAADPRASVLHTAGREPACDPACLSDSSAANRACSFTWAMRSPQLNHAKRASHCLPFPL